MCGRGSFRDLENLSTTKRHTYLLALVWHCERRAPRLAQFLSARVLWRRATNARPMDQESCRTSDVPLSRDFLGSASILRTFITTTVFFIIAERLSVAAVPCEIAAGCPVAGGMFFIVLRLLCVLDIIEIDPTKSKGGKARWISNLSIVFPS